MVWTYDLHFWMLYRVLNLWSIFVCLFFSKIASFCRNKGVWENLLFGWFKFMIYMLLDGLNLLSTYPKNMPKNRVFNILRFKLMIYILFDDLTLWSTCFCSIFFSLSSFCHPFFLFILFFCFLLLSSFLPFFPSLPSASSTLKQKKEEKERQQGRNEERKKGKTMKEINKIN